MWLGGIVPTKLPPPEVCSRINRRDSLVAISRALTNCDLPDPEQRSERERALARESDPLLEEVEAADVIVIGVPMYNFGIPSTLKAWVDHITRAGRTFRYTAKGPEGLLTNKKVFVIAARGGIYTGESPNKAFDFQESYLRAILGLSGLTDITFIRVEGQRMGPEAAEAGVAQVSALTERARAAA